MLLLGRHKTRIIVNVIETYIIFREQAYNCIHTCNTLIRPQPKPTLITNVDFVLILNVDYSHMPSNMFPYEWVYNQAHVLIVVAIFDPNKCAQSQYNNFS